MQQLKRKTIGIVGTLDTKFEEIMFLKKFVQSYKIDAAVFDCSMLKHDHFEDATFDPRTIAGEAGIEFDQVSSSKDRNFGTVTMAKGLGSVLMRMVGERKLDGVISVGGAQGTSISSSAFRELPIGFPKLIVSVVASGNIRPYVGEKDILVMFSVADINGGINQVTETILTNAASAIIGMALMGKSMISISHHQPIIGITTWGTTQKAVTSASDYLKSLGLETVLFHSSGACTSAMEDLVDQGVIDGVLDLTTHDVLGEVFAGVDIMPPTRPGRLVSAGRAGIPLVVAPGGLNMFVMGPYQDLEAKYKERPTLKHNPSISEVRVNLEELLKTASFIAERLNASKGYCAFLMPLKGWNDYDAEGMLLYRPEENALFLKRLRELLDPRIEIAEIDSNLNDANFGRFAAKLLADHLKRLGS